MDAAPDAREIAGSRARRAAGDTARPSLPALRAPNVRTDCREQSERQTQTWHLSLSLLNRLCRSSGFLREALEQAGPAAVDILAHGGARLLAHGLELVVHKLDLGRIRPTGCKPHIDLGFHREVRLPLRVDLPDHHHPVRRLPVRDGGDAGLGAVFGDLQPAPAELRLHHHLLYGLLADAMIMRPPA